MRLKIKLIASHGLAKASEWHTRSAPRASWTSPATLSQTRVQLGKLGNLLKGNERWQKT